MTMHRWLLVVLLLVHLCPVHPTEAYMSREELSAAQEGMRLRKFYLHGEPVSILKTLRCISQISVDVSLRFQERAGVGRSLASMMEFYPITDGSKMATFDNGAVGYPPQDMGPIFLLTQARRHPNRVMDPAEADFILMIAFTNEYAMVQIISEKFAVLERNDSNVEREHYSRQMQECRSTQLTSTKYLELYRAQVDELDLLARSHDIPFLWVCQSFRCGYLQTKYGRGNSFLSPYAYFAIHESNPKWLNHNLEDAVELRQRTAIIPYVGHSSFRSRKYRTLDSLKKVRGTFFFAGDFRGTPVREAFARIVNLPYVLIKSVGTEQKDGLSANDTKVDKYGGLDPYVVNVTTTEFCFVPRGDTPSSRRLFDAVLAGCIPVVISNKVDLPFSHKIPWHKIIIKVEESIWVKSPSSVVREIRNIAAEERTNMRRLMSAYWREIDYESKGRVFSNMLVSFNGAYANTEAYLDQVTSNWAQAASDLSSSGGVDDSLRGKPTYASYASSDMDWVASDTPNDDFFSSDDANEKFAAQRRVRWNNALYWKHWIKAFPKAAREENEVRMQEREAMRAAGSVVGVSGVVGGAGGA
jgi:hypothetical protein